MFQTPDGEILLADFHFKGWQICIETEFQTPDGEILLADKVDTVW